MREKRFLKALAAAGLVASLTACSIMPEPKQTVAKAEQKKSDSQKTPHWSYEGEAGPSNWGKLDQSFSTCADGREQSPIDIELAKVKVDKSEGTVITNYGSTVMTVINNGHTIQVNDPSGRNSITMDGKQYKLVQMHFHRPSENQINGQNFAMEGHFVHKDSNGGLAVISFLIKEGSENKQLAEIFRKLPKEETEKETKLNSPVDLVNLLPKNKKSFRYNGSLTTPPCTEGVKWIVLQTPIELSKEQIAAFGAIFPDNHRPVQPLNNRQVLTN